MECKVLIEEKIGLREYINTTFNCSVYVFLLVKRILSNVSLIIMSTFFSLADTVQTSVHPQSREIERQVSSPLTCEICCEQPRNTVLTCGHQFCETCANKVDSCPVCRKFIRHRIVTFN